MALSSIPKTRVILITLLIFFHSAAFAQEASLSKIIVTNTRDDLLVYLTVDGAFREQMKQAILSGVPATFSFLITLDRVRNLWADKEVVDLKVSHTIKYNNLKKEFSVKRSWESGKPLVTQSFEEAKKKMSEIDGMKLISLSRLEKDKQYQLGAKAELNKMTLPFYLHHVLFFVSLWDFETEWFTIDFIY
jgi:uncharacterized protein DUF4390